VLLVASSLRWQTQGLVERALYQMLPALSPCTVDTHIA
jgi:hypothetical protein